jgi:hypothetical protein
MRYMRISYCLLPQRVIDFGDDLVELPFELLVESRVSTGLSFEFAVIQRLAIDNCLR